jgi:FkbM family methyltransferase
LQDLARKLTWDFGATTPQAPPCNPLRNGWTKIDLSGRWFLASDPARTRAIHRSYFIKERYRFRSEREAPLVIDCGAHIGVSVHYWKFLFPDARVIAFEPDPDNFGALTANCSGLSDVVLHNAAVWSCSGMLRFVARGSVGGHLSVLTGHCLTKAEIEVPALRLRDFLAEPVDLLKLDIEGAEIDVLIDSIECLPNVKNIFVEYHSFYDRPQRLSTLFSVLEEAGFRLHALPELPAPQPFIERRIINNKDFRLNVFGTRTSGIACPAIGGSIEERDAALSPPTG